MLLSNFVDKTLVLNKTPRGKCFGVGISSKNKSLKYLFCATDGKDEFALPVTALASFSDNALFLSRLRPLLPKPCAKLFLGTPVFSAEGKFLGRLTNVEFQNHRAVRIFTDTNGCFPCSSIAVIADAILLRKPQPYPLGQPLNNKNDPLVTKRILRNSIRNQSLIHLTLSLPPFEHDLR